MFNNEPFLSDWCLKSPPLDLIDTGKGLKVQTATPHLVSLGSGRLSVAITLLPLKEGKTPGETRRFLQHEPRLQGSTVPPPRFPNHLTALFSYKSRQETATTSSHWDPSPWTHTHTLIGVATSTSLVICFYCHWGVNYWLSQELNPMLTIQKGNTEPSQTAHF